MDKVLQSLAKYLSLVRLTYFIAENMLYLKQILVCNY